MSQSDEIMPVPSHVEIYDGTSVQVFPAPLGKRMMALAVDYGIVGMGMYALFFVLLLVFGSLAVGASFLTNVSALLSQLAKGTLAVSMIFVIAVIVLGTMAMIHGYFIYFEHKMGSTPGKALFGLQVISSTGGRLTMRQCVIREMFRAMLDVPFVLPGLISINLTEKKQRLGDLVAGTIVVHSKAKEKKSESIFLPQEQFAAMELELAPRRLKEGDTKEFLRFCNSRYISGHATPESDLVHWESVVRGHLNPNTVDAETIVLFYAEFLYRNQT